MKKMKILAVGLNWGVDSGNETQFCLDATDYDIITIFRSRKTMLTKLVSLKWDENSANFDPKTKTFQQLKLYISLPRYKF